jgi:hypothetical protein
MPKFLDVTEQVFLEFLTRTLEIKHFGDRSLTFVYSRVPICSLK